MDKVTLGRSGLKVSPICFGTWELGGEWGSFDEKAATAAIRRARPRHQLLRYRAGLRLRRLGATARRGTGRRPSLGTATKWWSRRRADCAERVTVSFGTQAQRGCAREWTRASTRSEWTRSTSIKCIGPTRTHRLPRPPARWPSSSRRARFATPACRTSTPTKWKCLPRTARSKHSNRRITCSAARSTTPVLPYCRAHDIGVLVYGPLAHGLLTGAMRASTVFAADDWRSKSPDFTGETFRRNLAVVDDLKQFAADRDLSLPVLALAWTLANPAVDAAIVGTSNPAHLTDTVNAVDVRLSPEDLAEIDRILAGSAPVHGPSPEGMPPS